MPREINSVDCSIIFNSPQGKFVFDPIDLSEILDNIDTEKSDWVSKFRAAIYEKYQVQISGADVYNLVDAINDTFDELKKTNGNESE